jgi:pSer/pThr/pTyr-binding forkhead associated (FHA) protein
MRSKTPRHRPSSSPTESDQAPGLSSGALLVWGEHARPLSEGALIVGRAENCDIVLDDPLVSRQHARIYVLSGDVFVEDLGSANGVYVNGVRSCGPHRLLDGDRVLLATRELSVFALSGEDERPMPERTSEPPNPEALARPTLRTDAASTDRADPLAIAVTVTDQLLARDHVAEAETGLEEQVLRALERGRSGRIIPGSVCDSASLSLLTLAQVTGKAKWLGHAIELHSFGRRVMSDSLIDQLERALLAVSGFDRASLTAYVALLQQHRVELSDDESRRLERLEKLAARSS